jgi:hypothetical protein
MKLLGNYFFNLFLFFFLFIGLTFSQTSDQTCIKNSVFLAIAITLSIIIILFLIGSLFNFEQLKFIAKKELGDIFVSVVLISIFALSYLDVSIFLSNYINFNKDYWNDISKNNENKKLTIQDKAFILLENANKSISSISRASTNFFKEAFYEASKTYYTNFLSTGFGVSACSVYSVLRGPASLFFNALAVSSIAISFNYFIISLFTLIAPCVLIPFAIFLRLFNLTRKAGTLLLSLCLAFYFVFPSAFVFFTDIFNVYSSKDYVSVVFKRALFLESSDKATYSISCDAESYNDLEDSFNFSINRLLDSLDSLILILIIKNVFILILSFSITLAFVSSISSLLGLEIDLTSLSRMS